MINIYFMVNTHTFFPSFYAVTQFLEVISYIWYKVAQVQSVTQAQHQLFFYHSLFTYHPKLVYIDIHKKG